MQYGIYRNTSLIATVQPQGTLSQKIMGEELVTMNFTLSQKISFKINDTVSVYGNTYYLLNEPTLVEVSSVQFDYTLQFAGIKYELAKPKYLFPDANNNLTKWDFDILGTANQMLDLIVQNANRIQSGWSVGTVANLGTKQIDFNGDNCLTALAKIAEEFKIEYWVDGNKTIHLTERKAVSGYTFHYGKNNGLRSLTQTPLDNSNIVTRVYAMGGEKNIPANYRNYSKNLQMPVPYVERNTTIYEVIEHTMTFEEIFPKRIGTVTTIDTNNFLKFTDSGLDFDLNQTNANGTTVLINGVSAKVTFNTGQLAGYTFEIKENGFDSATKTFELLPNKDEKDLQVPSALLRPAVGDLYVITDIIMPQSYITNAELEVQGKAQAYLNENSDQRFVYTAETDPLYFKTHNINIPLGNTVRIQSTPLNLDANLRVVALIRDLQAPYDVEMELAEKAVLAQVVRDYIKEEKERLKIYRQNSYNAEMARRSYNFAREFHDKVFDGEGYFDPENIKPLSIETKMLSVGSKMQQFSLPDIELVIEDTTTISHTAGKLVHLTLEENIREWDIAATTLNNVSTDFNYIYVKADKDGTDAFIVITPNKIMVDQDEDFYHFEVGYLSSVLDGVRRIKTTYGFTQITPSEITTGRIASANGEQYIDILQDKIVINADVRFGSNSDVVTTTTEQVMQSIKIGANNLLVNSSFLADYYSMDEEKKKRYFAQPQTYTFSVDAISPVDFTGQIHVVAKNIKTVSFEHLKSEPIELQANIRKRVKVTFTAILSHLKRIYCKIQNDNDDVVVETLQPKLELGTVATDWDFASEDIKKEVKEVETGLIGFQNVVNTSFKDGVISASEAKSIQKYINTLNNEKADLDQKFYQIYNDPYVGYSQKSNLQSRKLAYDAAHNSLIALINSVVARGNVSSSDQYNVNYAFNTYRSALATLRGAFEFAVKSIETNKSNVAENNAKTHATIINNSLANGAVAANSTKADQAIVKADAALVLASSGSTGGTSPQDAITIANIQAVTTKLQQKTDYINETKVNGNTVCTGVLGVGNQYGMNAFISGVDTGPNGVRFGAGATWASRNYAPFRVTDDGSLYATKANIQGHITATSGSFTGNINAASGNIGNFSINSGGLTKSFNNGYVGYSAELKTDELVMGKRVGIGTPSLYTGHTNYTTKIAGDEIRLTSGSNEVVISASGIRINGRNL